MKEYNLIIDGGTTNTRFTLLDQDKPVLRTECRVGAVNANSSSANEQLKKAVINKINELEEQNNCIITEIFASGMITSNAGLYELPHLEAPVSFLDLAEGVQVRKLPGFSERALFHFIPGIIFHNQPRFGIDMLRGEEVEIIGALKPEDKDKSILFLHFGSHNKLMYYTEGMIQNAVTTIGGELFWTIITDTIIKSSVGRMKESFTLDEDYVKIGFKETKENNISRSVFQARIHHVVNQAGPKQVISYICGAVMNIDLQAFAPLLNQRADKYIIYGREIFIEAFNICLPLLENGTFQNKMEVISYEESEWLSVKGVQVIRNRYKSLHTGSENV